MAIALQDYDPALKYGATIADTGEVVTGTLSVSSTSTLTGAVSAASTLAVTGAITGAATLAITGATTLTGALTTTGGIAQATAYSGAHNIAPSTATSGTDTAFANGTQFVTSIFIPANITLTGVGYLLGSVGGTDKVYAVLYNAAGTNVANSSLTTGGATAGTAAQTQTLAFTSTYAAVGPAMYYIGISANGNTAKIRTLGAYTAGSTWGNSVAQVHGTVAAIAAPTTFTADKAPFVYVY